MADQHAVPRGAGASAELAQQAGLADPGVAADQDQPASGVVGHADGIEELLELTTPADERDRRRPVLGHGSMMSDAVPAVLLLAAEQSSSAWRARGRVRELPGEGRDDDGCGEEVDPDEHDPGGRVVGTGDRRDE